MGKTNHVKVIPRYLEDSQCKWIERDELMMHYMFECLCNFMENDFLERYKVEDGKIYDTWTGDDKPYYCSPIISKDENGFEENYEWAYELVELYEWWTKTKTELENDKVIWKGKDKECCSVLYRKHGEAYHWYVCDSPSTEKWFDKKDNDNYGWWTWQELEEEEMLQRLLNVRKYMWT